LQAHQTLVRTELVMRRKAEMLSMVVGLRLAAIMPALLYEGEAKRTVADDTSK
jgi:hypothetical protein